MSGHSKWSTIKHKKGAADAKRGKLFSKLSRAIMVAAKEGGADPGSNLALQNAIEKARSYSMPKDNIERAIAKGTGEGTDGSIFETVVCEGYGPEGVAVIVEPPTTLGTRPRADAARPGVGARCASDSARWLRSQARSIASQSMPP